MSKSTGIQNWRWVRFRARLDRSRARIQAAADLAFGRGERADVLAYLARKRANAERMAAKSPEFADEARWTMRQIDVFTGDLIGGLHEGEAALQAKQAAVTEGS